MKIGLCMLLWTTEVTSDDRALLEDLRATGYDGVEIPIFGGEPEDYARLGSMLDEIGLERTRRSPSSRPRRRTRSQTTRGSVRARSPT